MVRNCQKYWYHFLKMKENDLANKNVNHEKAVA